MKIGKPQVHLRKDLSSGNYMIHVVTWMDQTRFVADGYDTLPTTATSHVFPVTLFIREDETVPDMTLLTPVVHTLVLTDVPISATDPFIEVSVVNSNDSSLIGKTKPHQDDSDDTGMPSPKKR